MVLLKAISDHLNGFYLGRIDTYGFYLSLGVTYGAYFMNYGISQNLQDKSAQ